MSFYKSCVFNSTQCRNAKTTTTITRHVALLGMFFVEQRNLFVCSCCVLNSVTCLFVYICHAFISGMCLFKSVFCLFKCSTCMFIVVCAIVR